jgi:autotransporter-associated beta strand protein
MVGTLDCSTFPGASGIGVYNLSGSGQLLANNVFVGDWGPGAFIQTGGVNTTNLLVDFGVYNLSGSGQLLARAEQVSGIFAHTGGSNTVAISLDNDGVYNLSGSALLAASNENVGYSGTGVFTQSGGTNMAGALCLGYSAGSSGTYNLNGGLLNVSTLSGGSGAAAFNFNGGTFQAGSGFSSSLAMTLGTNGGGATFDAAGNSVTLSGSLSGLGGLTMNDSLGTGTLSLTGSNTYTGPTTINQGKLVVDGWLTNSAVSVNGGTLAGTGYLSSVTVNPGGTLSPGDALGTLSISGSLILATGAALDYELDTPSTSDMIACGSLVLNGQQFSDFNFSWTANFAPGVYDLIEAGSAPSGSLGTSTSGTIDGLPATLSLQDNDLVLTIVPEPSSLALLAAGAVGLIGWARRRFKAVPRSSTANER